MSNEAGVLLEVMKSKRSIVIFAEKFFVSRGSLLKLYKNSENSITSHG